MRANEIEGMLKKELGESVLETRVQTRKIRGHSHESIWARIKKDALRDAAKFAMSFGRNHLAVISGTDLGKNIELLYHFCIGHGEKDGEVVCTFCIAVGKGGVVQSITDIVPGAVLTEREKMEFFGIDFDGLRDKRRAFLSNDLAHCHPWIRDDPGTEKIMKSRKGGGKK